ncbi:ribonuclease HII [Oligella urethralis]|uniref:Ribonuclease HII n=1 Tax=Oligella urethralis TaxID=90245 RepID=A0A2X1WP68_9BURK|nr:ribonuclease HII [Oligella urethralis]SPY08545.1 Ribonuclease HII [Oligella urethralis]
MSSIKTFNPMKLDAGALIVGIDEAGRGPLAGSVFAAAVILDPNKAIEGLMDSKKLSEKKRDYLATIIKAQALAWSIASASVEEIDRLNILEATMLAMMRAWQGIKQAHHYVLIDGNQIPKAMRATLPDNLLSTQHVEAIVKGDDSVPAIAAASILAKTARDAELYALDAQYPDYGFAQHKGYGTKLHLSRLEALGPCPIHRQSFAPIKRFLQQPQS